MWTGLISPIMRGLGQAAARQAAQGLHSNNLRPTVTRNMRLALALVSGRPVISELTLMEPLHY